MVHLNSNSKNKVHAEEKFSKNMACGNTVKLGIVNEASIEQSPELGHKDKVSSKQEDLFSPDRFKDQIQTSSR